MESAPDPSICPSCGAPNTCGVSQGKSECWCFTTSIPKAALERVPVEAKDLACLCPRCAALAESESSAEQSVQLAMPE
jgi:hypothetical protein